GQTKLVNVKAEWQNPSSHLSFEIPELDAGTNFSSSNFSSINFDELSITQPEADFEMTAANDDSVQSAPKIPVNLFAGKFTVNGGKLNAQLNRPNDTSKISSAIDLKADSILLKKNADQFFFCKKMDGDLSHLSLVTGSLTANFPSVKISS